MCRSNAGCKQPSALSILVVTQQGVGLTPWDGCAFPLLPKFVIWIAIEEIGPLYSRLWSAVTALEAAR
jgi:hypothetical protein